MEGLELLKKDWKKNENSFAQLTDTDIYAMLHKKSSSIVKWILIISILEVLLWTGVSLINSDDYINKLEYGALSGYFTAFNFFNYAVILIFIVLFYNNYRRISATESTRQLMTDIIKTRKTVKFYVWYNLIMIAVTLVMGFIIAFNYNPEVIALGEKLNHDGKLMALILALITLCIALFLGLFWLFYRLLYGILLKRLLVNYKELKKIDLAE
ncbi:MAG: hypothetical protein ITG00_07875 [Flavobacterium sp.]|nr:hypothetical protein [Flavobacterium sp.]